VDAVEDCNGDCFDAMALETLRGEGVVDVGVAD
jgi:hypothetical protein